LKFEVVGLILKLFDEILLELEEEIIAGWGDAYEQSRMLRGRLMKDDY